MIFQNKIKAANILGKTTKAHKQLTLDNLPNAPTREPNISKPIQPKQIVITESEAITKEDELTLKVAFKLFPSKAAFSTIKSDLWFENQLIKSALVRIPQGPMNGEAFELTPILNMKG